MPTNTLPDSVKEAFFNSKLFKKYVASLHLTKGIEALQEQDTLYQQVVRDITNRCNKVRSEETVDEILRELVNVVEDHTDLVDSDITQEDLDALLEHEKEANDDD